ncbi:unnamed protein product [Peronospora belbahrii]|uniref:Copper transporter n=1 Tax=Peronospora belbahrii TaxID=622444 RepID=A0ABN8CR78_9STRA|nr:unnamed protein product [Peronospora belbahrii]
MVDEADWLRDLAALASLTVTVHYVLGIYGLLGALLIFVYLEHGPSITQQLKLHERMEERTSSALSDNASTEENDQEQRDQEDPQDTETQQQQRSSNTRKENMTKCNEKHTL